MKYSAVIILLFMLFLNAQNLSENIIGKGFIGGLNIADMKGSDIRATDYKFGFAVGAFVEVQRTETFSLRPEIYWSVKGFEMYESEDSYGYEYEYEFDMTLHYIEVPFLFIFPLDPKIKLFAGPSVEIFINGEVSIREEYYESGYEVVKYRDDIESDFMNIPSFGMIFGFEYSFDKIFISFRYNNTITDTFDEKIDASNQVFQFLLGFNLVAKSKELS